MIDRHDRTFLSHYESYRNGWPPLVHEESNENESAPLASPMKLKGFLLRIMGRREISKENPLFMNELLSKKCKNEKASINTFIRMRRCLLKTLVETEYWNM